MDSRPHPLGLSARREKFWHNPHSGQGGGILTHGWRDSMVWLTPPCPRRPGHLQAETLCWVLRLHIPHGIQGTEYLSHLPECPKYVDRELEWKWHALNFNWCSYVSLTHWVPICVPLSQTVSEVMQLGALLHFIGGASYTCLSCEEHHGRAYPRSAPSLTWVWQPRTKLLMP